MGDGGEELILLIKGAITADLIYAHLANILAEEYDSSPLTSAVVTWLMSNLNFMVLYTIVLHYC